MILSGCVGSVGSIDDGMAAEQFSEHVQTKYENIESYEATVETRIDSPSTTRTTRMDVVAKPHAGLQRMEFHAPEAQAGNVVVTNETTTVTTTCRNLSFNTGVDNATFDYTPPEDATVETTTIPTFEQFESRSAAADNTSISIPDPTLPDGFSLDTVTVTENGKRTGVTLRYDNGTSDVSVSKRLGTNNTLGSEGEHVEIGNVTGNYRSIGSIGMLS